MEAVNKGMAKGAIWMILFRFVNRGIGLVSTIILARLLVPADFGLVALATAITAAVELLSAFSLDVVLIQNQKAERRHYDTAWTFNAIMGGILAAGMFAAAPLAASFYGEPRLEAVIYALAAGTFLQGLENIGVVEFRKELAFHKDFYFQVAKKLIAFVTTVALALIFKNYWALVVGGLVSKAMGVALSFYIQAYRPRFSLAAWRELFHFSKWLFINNGLFFANHKSADFILGKLSGAHGLGLYSLAYEISNLPSTELVAPINRAIFPGYAKMADDLPVLRQAFLNVIAAIALFALPAGAGIALVATPMVHLLLGDKWVETIPLIQILAFSGVVAALQTNKGSVYLALGRPRIMTALAGVHVGLLLPALLVGTHFMGVQGAAWATLAVGAGLMPFNYAVLFHVLKLKPVRLLAVLWRPFLATGAMALAVTGVLNFMGGETGLLGWTAQLALSILVGGLVYGGTEWLLWRLSGRPEGVEDIIMTRLSKQMKAVLSSIQERCRAA